MHVASDITRGVEPENIVSLYASKIVDAGFRDFIHRLFLPLRKYVFTQRDLELFFDDIQITPDRNAIVYYTGHGVTNHILLPDGNKYSALELRSRIINLGSSPLSRAPRRISGDEAEKVRSSRDGLNSIGSSIFIIFDCCNPHGLYLPFEMNRSTYDYSLVGNSFTLPEMILITSSESNSQSQAKRSYSMFTKELFEIFKCKSKRYDFQSIITTLDRNLVEQRAMVRASTPKLRIPWSWVTNGILDVEIHDVLEAIIIHRNQ